MTNGSENPKNEFLLHLTLLLGSGFFAMMLKIHICNNFSWVVYLFDSNFISNILISCKIGLKKFVSLTMVAMEAGKRYIPSHNSNACKAGKTLHQKHELYRFKLLLKKIGWLDKCRSRKSVAIWKMYILRTRMQKLKNTTFLHFATFYS